MPHIRALRLVAAALTAAITLAASMGPATAANAAIPPRWQPWLTVSYTSKGAPVPAGGAGLPCSAVLVTVTGHNFATNSGTLEVDFVDTQGTTVWYSYHYWDPQGPAAQVLANTPASWLYPTLWSDPALTASVAQAPLATVPVTLTCNPFIRILFH